MILRMTRPAVRSLLVAVAVAVAAAVGSLALVASASATALAASPSAWARAADAVCVRYGKEAARIAPPTSAKSLIAASEQLAAIEQRRAAELAKLKRPAGAAAAAAIAKLIGAFEAQVAVLRSLIAAVRHDDEATIKQLMADGSRQNEQAVALARKLGAARCAA